jgi:hypothetical protein
MLACLLCACCVLADRSRPSLFKKEIRLNQLKHHIKPRSLRNPFLCRWFRGALLGSSKAPVVWTQKDLKPIEGSTLTTRK